MQQNRFWEIDFFRGLAVFLMIIYHFIFDLNYFNFISINMYSGFLGILQKFIAITFISLVGISLSLSSKAKSKKQNFKRGLLIFSLGLILTLLSYIFVKESVIYFGILHLIGISIIISIPFLKYFKLNLFLGILVLIFNRFISSISVNYKWLIPIGIRYPNFKTLDYFPLIPWFALVLFGIFIGKILYDENRKFKFINEPKIFIINIFKFLSKNSLTIYLLHQPIMIAILYLIKSIK